jgi:hypothetical protein
MVSRYQVNFAPILICSFFYNLLEEKNEYNVAPVACTGHRRNDFGL